MKTRVPDRPPLPAFGTLPIPTAVPACADAVGEEPPPNLPTGWADDFCGVVCAPGVGAAVEVDEDAVAGDGAVFFSFSRETCSFFATSPIPSPNVPRGRRRASERRRAVERARIVSSFASTQHLVAVRAQDPMSGAPLVSPSEGREPGERRTRSMRQSVKKLR